MKKKKIEFSKALVVVILILAVRWVEKSYILAENGHEVNEQLSISIVTLLISVVLGYLIKSFGEKNSMNKYNVDAEAEEVEFGTGAENDGNNKDS